jgi:hypothetical protein
MFMILHTPAEPRPTKQGASAVAKDNPLRSFRGDAVLPSHVKRMFNEWSLGAPLPVLVAGSHHHQ